MISSFILYSSLCHPTALPHISMVHHGLHRRHLSDGASCHLHLCTILLHSTTPAPFHVHLHSQCPLICPCSYLWHLLLRAFVQGLDFHHLLQPTISPPPILCPLSLAPCICPPMHCTWSPLHVPPCDNVERGETKSSGPEGTTYTHTMVSKRRERGLPPWPGDLLCRRSSQSRRMATSFAAGEPCITRRGQ